MRFYLMCALCKLSTNGCPYVAFCYSPSTAALLSCGMRLDDMENSGQCTCMQDKWGGLKVWVAVKGW